MMSETKQMKKSDAEWQAELTDEQYKITRCAGTERAFTGPYWDCKDDGIYHCICCQHPLFSSETKYDSGTGWPSFYQPLTPDAVVERFDETHGMRRTESICAQCEAHLGHVFTDGPQPSGLRYCINGTALKFEPDDK